MNMVNPITASVFMALSIGALAGCATGRVGEVDKPSGDATITKNVETLIDQHSELAPPEEISVQTRNHVVYLSGLVDDGVEAENAEQVAREAGGVSDVINMIAVTQ
jgi:osmotically-inducible protein OsmY